MGRGTRQAGRLQRAHVSVLARRLPRHGPVPVRRPEHRPQVQAEQRHGGGGAGHLGPHEQVVAGVRRHEPNRDGRVPEGRRGRPHRALYADGQRSDHEAGLCREPVLHAGQQAELRVLCVQLLVHQCAREAGLPEGETMRQV